MPKQGWWLPMNSKKAHYIMSNRSLCGKWGYLGSGESLEDNNHDSRDNCADCRKKYYQMIGREVPLTAKEINWARCWNGCDTCIQIDGKLAQPCAKCLPKYAKANKIMQRLQKEREAKA